MQPMKQSPHAAGRLPTAVSQQTVVFAPKVIFVNEHREVDVESGRLLSDVAKELGIQLCREELANTGFGNYSVWIQGEEGCVSPPSLWERLRGVKGWRRYANKTKILQPLNLTDAEKEALVAFLEEISGKEIRMAVPKVPPYGVSPDVPGLTQAQAKRIGLETYLSSMAKK